MQKDQNFSQFELYINTVHEKIVKSQTRQIPLPTFKSENQMLRLIFEYVVKQTEKKLLSKQKLKAIFSIVNSSQFIASDFTDDYLHLMFLLVGKSSLVDHQQIQTIIQALLGKITKGLYHGQLNLKQKQEIINKWVPNRGNEKTCVLQEPHQSELFRNVVSEIIMKSTSESTVMTLMLITFAILRVDHSIEFYNIFFSSGIKNQKDYQLVRSCMPGKISKSQETNLLTKKIDMKEQMLTNFMLEKIVKHSKYKLSQSFIIFTIIQMSRNYSVKNIPILKQFLSSNQSLSSIEQTQDAINEIRQRYFQALVQILIKPQYNKDQLYEMTENLIQKLVKQKFTILMLKSTIKKIQTNYNKKNSLFKTDLKQIFHIFMVFRNYYSENKSFFYFTSKQAYLIRKFVEKCEQSTVKITIGIMKIKKIGRYALFSLFSHAKNSPVYYFSIQKKSDDQPSKIFIEIVQQKKFLIQSNTDMIITQQIIDFVCQFQPNKMRIQIISSKKQHVILETESQITSIRIGSFGKSDVYSLSQRQTCVSSLRQLQFVKITLPAQGQLLIPQQSNTDLLSHTPQQKSSKLNFLNLFDKNEPTQLNIKVSPQKSFFEYFRELGGTDLIFLLTSHLLSSLQDNASDEQYLISILNSVLQIDKQYQEHYPLSASNKQKRLSYIIYLCWWAVTNFRSRKVILELLRFIKVINPKKSIRKDQIKIQEHLPIQQNKNYIYLNVLCNFSIWRKMSVEDQIKMLESCKPLICQLKKNPKSIYYCKCILIELVATYKIPLKKQIKQGKSSNQIEQEISYHQQDQQYFVEILKLAAQGATLIADVISGYLVNKSQNQQQCPNLQVYKQFFDAILFIIQVISSYIKKYANFLQGQKQSRDQLKISTKFEYSALFTTSNILLLICSELNKKQHLREIIQSLKKSSGLVGEFYETICKIYVQLEHAIKQTGEYQLIAQKKLESQEIIQQFRIGQENILNIYNQKEQTLEAIKTSQICQNLIKAYFQMSLAFDFNALLTDFAKEMFAGQSKMSFEVVINIAKYLIVKLQHQKDNITSEIYKNPSILIKALNSILFQIMNQIVFSYENQMQQINMSGIQTPLSQKLQPLIKKLYQYLLKSFQGAVKFQNPFLGQTLSVNQQIYEELMKLSDQDQIKSSLVFQSSLIMVNLTQFLIYVQKVSKIQAQKLEMTQQEKEIIDKMKQKHKLLQQNINKIQKIQTQQLKQQLKILANQIQNQQYNKTDILQTITKIYQFISNNFKIIENKPIPLKKNKIVCPVQEFSLSKTKKVTNISNVKLFFQQRSNFLTKASKRWMELQQNNQYFWKLFSQSHSYYRLDSFTNNLKQKIFLTIEHQKPQLILPQIKNVEFASQIDPKTSSSSNNFERKGINISYYDEFQGLQDNKQQLGQAIKKPKKTSKQEKYPTQRMIFFVLLLTQDRTYQGDIFIKDGKVIFIQRQQVRQDIYNKFLINPVMQRKPANTLAQGLKTQISIGQINSIMFKKYLQNPNALEIQTNSQCLFFIFSNTQLRQQFINVIKNTSEDITKMLMLQKEQLHKYCFKWKTGLISNFKYLMILNDYSGRSMIDISQYYVFPWTITNFTDNLDSNFLSDEKNLRKLNFPMGKINQERWNAISKRFEESLKHYKQTGQQPFLYGSFFSNPAIVSGYLIRIFPFSQYQYLLQNSKFDHADRLFHGIQQLFQSCSNNIADLKELTPQFYSNSQFLFNRNIYDFGGKQCGHKVDDVKLPSWVKTQRPQEFIFKMRRALECHYTKSHLNQWIDLVFGIYNKRQNAMEKSNLFNENVYQQDLQNLNKQDKSFRQQFYKQFGQMPDCIFQGQHPQAQQMGLPNETIQLPKIEKYFEKHLTQKKKECKIVAKNDIRLIKNGKTITIYASIHKLQNQEQNDNFELTNEKCSSFDFIEDTIDFDFNTFISFFHVQANQLYLSLITKSVLTSNFKFSKTKKKFFTSKSIPVQLVRTMGSNIIISSDSNILVYSHSKSGYKKRKKSGVDDTLWENNTILIQDILFEPVGQFTQHNAIIKHIDVCRQIFLVTSVDQLGRIFIWQIVDKNIKVRNFFDLQTLFCSQTVKDVRLHQMGLIIVYTSQQRILVYNYFGQLIINSKISFKKEQKLTSIEIFNHESSELLLGTSIGNIWKVDLFNLGSSIYSEVLINIEFNDAIKISLEKSQDPSKYKTISDIQIIRYGLHWKIYAITQRGRVFTVCSPFFIKAKKQIFTERLDND